MWHRDGRSSRICRCRIHRHRSGTDIPCAIPSWSSSTSYSSGHALSAHWQAIAACERSVEASSAQKPLRIPASGATSTMPCTHKPSVTSCCLTSAKGTGRAGHRHCWRRGCIRDLSQEGGSTLSTLGLATPQIKLTHVSMPLQHSPRVVSTLCALSTLLVDSCEPSPPCHTSQANRLNDNRPFSFGKISNSPLFSRCDREDA